MIFCFIVPLQCYTIGNNLGAGIQGAVFRFQMTGAGNSLIPLPYEVGYISRGIYQGKTAISALFWVLGTLILTGTTIFSLVHWNRISRRFLNYIVIGIAGSCLIYLASCIIRYGPLFSAPSGTSLPLGILALAMFAVFLYYYRDLYVGDNVGSVEQ